jgi:heme-degrading monooxygenase HmoA
MTTNTGAPSRPLVVRSWRGVTRTADADAYDDYLHATGYREYAATPGNLGVLALRRPLQATGGVAEEPRTEWLLLTLWESMDAVRRFAGAEPERAVFYPEDERFLVDRDLTVHHWEIAHRSAFAPIAGP